MKQKEIILWIAKYFIPVVIILILGLFYIHDNQMIKICGDEFGYWAAGSWIAGYDWSEVQSINSYYGYGYGVILSIILKFTANQSVAYQIALFVNVVMLCGMYFLALGSINLLDQEEKIPDTIKVVISLVSILFSSNLYFTQYTMAETVLAFNYWIITYIFMLLLSHFTLPRMIVFYLFALFSVSIHLRTVGTLLVCIIMGVAILYKHQIKGAKLVYSFAILVLGCLVVMMFKKMYQNTYILNNDIVSDVNELAGQIEKLEYLFTKSGIKTFIRGILGKIFYAFNTTFLLSAIPIYVLIRWFERNIVRFKNKKEFVFAKLDLAVVFVILSTLSELLIDAVFMINYHERFDLLTYGRYFEHTLTPLILIGLFVIFYSDKRIGIYVVCLCFINLLLSSYINKIQNFDLAKSNVFINISSFYEILNKNAYAKDTWLLVGFKSMLILGIFTILTIFIKKKELTKVIWVMGLTVIAALWTREAKFTYEEGCLEWAISFQEAEMALADNIMDMGVEDDLIFYDEGDHLKVMPLQFLLKEHTIKVENDINLIENNNHVYVLSAVSNQEGTGDLDETKYELIAQSQWLRLWQKRY